MAERLFLTFKVTREGERGHPMDHVLTTVEVAEDGSIADASLDLVIARIRREVMRQSGGSHG